MKGKKNLMKAKQSYPKNRTGKLTRVFKLQQRKGVAKPGGRV
jgi:hypothetical protein